MNIEKTVWYLDYYRSTDDHNFVLAHFLRDFLFQHRLRYVVYFRLAQSTNNKLFKFIYEYMLYRLCRKYGIEIKTETIIGKGFVMIHPYNITISPASKLGKNCTILKGATIGVSYGKHEGAPIIGNKVYIGINSTIIGNITIGDDVLIAPNTLVNINVPSHSVVIGNPCKVIHRENATDSYIRKPI